MPLLRSLFAAVCLLLVVRSQAGRLTSARQATGACQCASSLNCPEYECVCRKGFLNRGCECAFAGSYYKTYTTCDTNVCCSTAGVRRLTTTASQQQQQPDGQNDDEYKEIIDRCGGYEYDGFLFVEDLGHLYAVARPKQDAMEANCPLLVAHSVFENPDDEPGEKELLLWEDVAEGDAVYSQQDSFHMGSFPLADLSRAYDAATPNAAGAGRYDIVSNNCSRFLLSLAKELGVTIDYKVTAYVARRLIHSFSYSNELIHSIRSAFHDGRFLLTTQESVSDEELVELLVEEQTDAL